MTRILPLLAVLLLVGCTADPQQIVFDARSAYDATVLAPAANYNELPRNGTPQCVVQKVCSDQKVVNVIRKTDDTAKIALDAAEDAVRNPDFDTSTKKAAAIAAQDAVTAAVKVLNLYGVK